jgi:hypothetical protein
VPAIEEALRVYEQHGRPIGAQLRLRSMLVMCGFLFDYHLAERHGTATLEALYGYSGLADAERYARVVGKGFGFLLGVLTALVRWIFARSRDRGPNVLASLIYFTRSAMGILGVCAVALDVTKAKAVFARMQAFEHSSIGSLRTTYMLAEGITLQLQGRESELYTITHATIARLESGRSALMSKQEHSDLLVGVLLMNGINECYREHSKALTNAKRLEQIGTPLAISAAQRIAMTYYLLRGDRERTQYHRRQLDLHAIQGSTTWQVEWFAVAIEGLAGGAWTDLISLRRSLDRLDALVADVPSLTPMRDSIRMAYHFRRGDFAQAAALGEAYVTAHAPRTLIGWGTSYAMTALSYVEIGEPERALLLVDRALANVSEEDRAYFVMYATLEVAQATALAVLGQRDRAEEIFRVRLTRLRASGEHPRAFIIHEYRTKVARLLGDRAGVLAALKDMREAALASGNAAVIALADRVAELRSRQRSSPLPPSREDAAAATPGRAGPLMPGAPLGSTGLEEETAVTMFLRDCKEPEKRAQHALVMLGQYASSGEGYLYWVTDENLQLAASLDERPPPSALERELGVILAGANEDRSSIVELPGSDASARRYRVLRLMNEDVEGDCVGIAALREADSALEEIPVSLVAEIGKVLRPTGITQAASSLWPKG